MFDLTIEILLVILLTVINGVFAMAELAVVSARKVRLEQRARAGDANARAALELANAPNRFLSTVQIGITLVGILAGAFGGATIATKLAALVRAVPFLAPYSDMIGLGIVVLSITFLSLVIGEIVPKRIALHNPERIAARVAVPMRMLATIAAPVIRLLSYATEIVLKPLGIKDTDQSPMTEEEINLLIRQGTQAGMFDAAEQNIIEQVFRLGDRRVSALMTPRPEIVWVDLEDSLEENQRKITSSHHSYFVVCRGGLANPVGVVHVKDLLAVSLACQRIDWGALSRPPLFVPESARALRVLEMFKESGTHIALAIDEYGDIQGLVALNDILNVLVGPVPLAGAPALPSAVQRADGSWLLDGILPLDEAKTALKLDKLPGEEQVRFQTIGGFVLNRLGRIPVPGDYFDWRGRRFEVVDMDDKRIDKILIVPTPAQSTETL